MGSDSFQSRKASAADGKVTVYRPQGKLNGHKDCYAWLEEVRADIRGGGRQIVLDCRELDRVDSTGLGIVASLHVSTSNAGGALYLTGLSGPIRTLFETTWLLRVIKNIDDEAEAIRACAGEA